MMQPGQVHPEQYQQYQQQGQYLQGAPAYGGPPPQPYAPPPQPYSPPHAVPVPTPMNMMTPSITASTPNASVWASGLMDCCDDGYICCVGYFMSACLYGENYRKIYGDGCCSATLLYYCCWCFACCFANHTRAALRTKYGLADSPCSDCCVHCWCSQCAVCQEARELRAKEKWKTWQ